MTELQPKKGLILTVGTTHEPIVYSLRELQPDYVAFIYTPGSSTTLDKVIEVFPIAPSCLWSQSVQDDPEQIGKLIQKLYSAFCWLKDEKQVEPSRIYTDPTPGRKWMSAGATMIASFVGLQMFYTDAKYPSGKLDPTTMRLVPLGNAYDQTGFIEAENARKLFNQLDFSSASEVFGQLRPTLSDQSDLYSGLAQIAHTLHRWELFEHYDQSLKQDFDEALARLIRYTYSNNVTEEFSQFVSQAQKLAEAIDEITVSVKPILLATVDLLLNAERRITQGRFDDAIARCYRTLESLSQFYLQKSFQINASKPDYKHLTEKQRQSLHNYFQTLPEKIALEDGWKILWALDHNAAKEVFQEEKGGKLNNKLAGVLDDRNSSILAHGWKPVGRERTETMINKLKSLILTVEGGTIEILINQLQVPKLPVIWKL